MNTSRRDFLKFGAAAVAASAAVTGCETLSEEQAITKRKFAGLKELPPAMPRLQVRDGALRGRVACKYVDDCIWFLRDLARQRPKSAFDHPFLAGFRKVHEATGLKVQFNLFYRTDFFYGMDEFTLADMPATYKAEFKANADWIKFGFHSLQEFPDYPWINASYDDVAKCLKMIRGEVSRFAGDELFARFALPHWVPMSKDGVRALKDAGITMMCATGGNRYAYNGDSNTLPYGHSFRVEQGRKPETALYTRVSNLLAISASACGYNHLTMAHAKAVTGDNKYVYDPDTGMRFRGVCTAPMSCLNLQPMKDVPRDLDAVKGLPFIGYGNHEQYFYKDYLAHQPDYMEKELVAARLFRENGYSFCFMEEMLGNGAR